MKFRRSRKPKFKVRRRRQVVALRSKFKKERKSKAAAYVKVLAVLGFLGVVGWWSYKGISFFIFDTGYFEIKKIEVTGIKNIARSEIDALLPFRRGDNMFSVWLSVAEKNLRQCKPELKNIKITRQWQGILVQLEERKPLATVRIEGRKQGLDEDNKPFSLRGRWIEYGRKKIPEIISKNEVERGNVLRFVKQLYLENKELYNQTFQAYMKPVNNVFFTLKDGTQVMWGNPSQKKLKYKIKRLVQVKDNAKKRFKNIEYINMCYFDDGRILIKPIVEKKEKDRG